MLDEASMKAIEQYMKFDLAYEYYNKTLFSGILPGAFITLQTRNRCFGYFSKERFKAIDTENKMDEIALNPDFFFFGETEIMQTLVHEMVHQWQRHFGTPSRPGYHNKEWARTMKNIGLMPSSTGEEGGLETGQKIADYIIPGGLFDLHTKDLLSREKIVQWEYFSWESTQLQMIRDIQNNTMFFDTIDGIKKGALITVGQTTAKVNSIDQNNSSVNFHVVVGPDNLKPDSEAFIKIPGAKRNNKTKYTCPECGNNVWGKPDMNISCINCDKEFIMG